VEKGGGEARALSIQERKKRGRKGLVGEEKVPTVLPGKEGEKGGKNTCHFIHKPEGKNMKGEGVFKFFGRGERRGKKKKKGIHVRGRKRKGEF